jgi:nicotinamidase-related amidase
VANPKLEVLTPQNSQIIFIDHQPQMAFGVQSIDRQTLKNNVVALAKAAKLFKIPTTITTVETQSFSGYSYPELLDVFPLRVGVAQGDEPGSVRSGLTGPMTT